MEGVIREWHKTKAENEKDILWKIVLSSFSSFREKYYT